MKQQHVKNHFVPKLYLKSWVKENGEIDVYKTLVPHENAKLWEPKSPSAIAWQKHLYTKTVSGEENDDFEKWFDREFESPAEAIIQKVINETRLFPSDWRILIRFLASQDLRTPASLLEYLHNEKDIIGALLEKNLKETSEKMRNKEFREQLVANDGDTPKAKFTEELPLKLHFYQDIETRELRVNAKSYSGRKSWLFLVKATLENSLKTLLKQKWSIIKPAKGYKFITSDNPVVKLEYSRDRSYKLLGAGIWEKKNITIIFPLSPYHAMLTQIGNNAQFIRGTRLTVNFTMELQGFIANNSHRRIFSQGIDSSVEYLKPRVVDKDFYLKERKQIEEWHEMNKELEKDYENG